MTLRYDPEPPQLGFESPSASDPTLVAVQVTDKVSGLADGAIEISATGSNTWQALATQKDGSRLVARIDDAALPAGDYVLRATRSRPGAQRGLDRRAARRPADGGDVAAADPSAMQAGVVSAPDRAARRCGGTASAAMSAGA